MVGPRKKWPSKRGARKEASKDPIISCKKCAKLETSSLEWYQSTMDEEDFSYIHEVYKVPKEFELEFPTPDTQVGNLSPS